MYGSIDQESVRGGIPAGVDRRIGPGGWLEPSGSARVLVVDEDAGFRSSLAEELRAEGHRVDEVISGVALLGPDRNPGIREADVVVACIRDRSVTLEALTGLVERGWEPHLVVVEATRDPVVRARIRALGPDRVVDGRRRCTIQDIVSGLA